jgi:hypothetical protein
VKFLTEDDVKWKGLQYYNSLKSKWNNDKYGESWQKKYAGKPSVGAMVYLCETWKPESYEDFFNMYISRHEGNDRVHRGRSLEELEEIAINWQNDSKDFETPLSEYFDAIILHTVVETYVGSDFEKRAVKCLEENGFKAIHGTDEEDSSMNIDYKIYKDNVLKFFLQVKPISFVVSDRIHTFRDRVNAFEKHDVGNKKYPGVPYYYLIYDGYKCKWIYNPDKKRCLFKYEELVRKNGLPLRSAYIMKKYEVDDLFNNN